MARSKRTLAAAASIAVILSVMSTGAATASECGTPGQAGDRERIEQKIARARRTLERDIRRAIDVDKRLVRERLREFRLQADRLEDMQVVIRLDRVREALRDIPDEIELIWTQSHEAPDGLVDRKRRDREPSLAHQVVDAILALTGKAGVFVGSLIQATAAVYRHGKEIFA